MKFLLVPGNNSLSHIAKCLAIDERLRALGHDSLLAVGADRAQFVRDSGRTCAILPDLQENDHAGLPTVQWFSDAEKISECIRNEVTLMKEYRPDRVLGVFRFTLKASAALAGIPFDSLTCGCMLHSSSEVLGFDRREEGAAEQKQYLDNFYRYAGRKVGAVLKTFGLEGIADIREMLQGERTFLWDFPEFAAVPPGIDTHHIGPVSWNYWPHDELDIPQLTEDAAPLAIVTFGTCVNSAEVAIRTVRLLSGMGYRVLLAAGGQNELLCASKLPARVTVCRFAPLHLLFPHAALLVCHGGQLTVFEALAHEVPVLVMPLQPEQAHNGLCLERLGCGKRLLPPQIFRGNSQVYIDAFQAMSDDDFCTAVRSCTREAIAPGRLAHARTILESFQATQTLCNMLVN
ncbi:glycosyl transferase [Geomonas sp. RF6]|uniref:glycosyltransferase n=1 Tax=Geomonas sp. RF6 TaxID=2897342 RepID=UPI001E5D70BC|nr:glycosyltransferase [Geomonas sp. RF6]UFS71914.1 glycosyl transferase [Geomonas sp. RF6]